MNKRRSPKHPDALIEHLASAPADISQLAEQQDISTPALARWLVSDAAAERIIQHTTHHNNNAALAVAKARGLAVQTLLGIARGESASETARKACVDILKLTDQGPSVQSQPLSTQEQQTVPEESIVHALAAKLAAPPPSPIDP